MNRHWHDEDGRVRTPSGGTHRMPAPARPVPAPDGQPSRRPTRRTLSVDERFETILVLEHLRDTTPSRLLHDVADRAIASMEDPAR